MFTMDFGFTCLGFVYKKFEAICLEVDEIMSENREKYPEDQVQTVDASVKNICSDVIQDSLSPSAGEPVEGATHDSLLGHNTDIMPLNISNGIRHKKLNIKKAENLDVNTYIKSKASPVGAEEDTVREVHSQLRSGQNDELLMYKMCKVGIEEDPIKVPLPPPRLSEDVTPVEEDMSEGSLFSEFIDKNIELICDVQDKISAPTSGEFTGCNTPENAERLSDYPVEAINYGAGVSRTLACSDMIRPVAFCGNKVSNSEANCCSRVLSVGSNVECADTSTADAIVHPMESSGYEYWQDNEHAESDANMFTAEIGDAEECHAEEAAGNDFAEPGIRTCELHGNMKLEESCVVVDSNELCFVFHRASKHGSYDKNAMDAFPSKLRLGTKQESEKLVIQYEDIGTWSNEPSVESLTPSSLSRNPDLKEMATDDFCIAEWELL